MLIKFIFIFLIFFLFFGCSSSNNTVRSRYVSRNYDYRKDYRLNTNNLMLAINEWIGTPYCYGGESKNCTDCSGFVKQVFLKACGAKLPKTAKAQFKIGRPISKAQLKKGDLVLFYIGPKRSPHIGIYIDSNKFAHASVSSGVMISSLDEPYFKSSYVGARRFFL